MTLYTPVPNVIYIISFVIWVAWMITFVSVWQNVLLKTPFAAGATAEAVSSTLPGFYMSVRRQFFS